MRRITWVLAATVFAMLVAPSAKGQQAKEKPPLTTASGLLRIVSDVDSMQLLGLIQDFRLFINAIKQISPEAAKSQPPVANINVNRMASGTGGRTWTFDLSIHSFDERVPADKLIEGLRAAVETEVERLDTANQTDRARRDRLMKELQNTSRELAKHKDTCHALARLHKVPATPEIAAQQRARLDAQIESASVELEGLDARRHALELQIAEVGKAGPEAVANDPVVVELEKAVKLRQAIVEQRKAAYNANKVTIAEVLSAESELAEHKAELAKFRREAAQAAGGARLVELRRRLEDAAIEQAEATAKRKALVGMRDSIGFSAELDIKRLEIERLESSYREVGRELDELNRKLMLYQPPEVTLISTP